MELIVQNSLVTIIANLRYVNVCVCVVNIFFIRV